MSKREIDPYRKVWDTVEDDSGKSNRATLNVVKLPEWVFVPTWEEIGLRHKTTCRHLLYKARNAGNTVEGHALFEEALSHRRMAKFCLDKHREVMLKSR
jgi:hypothetical protein